MNNIYGSLERAVPKQEVVTFIQNQWKEAGVVSIYTFKGFEGGYNGYASRVKTYCSKHGCTSTVGLRTIQVKPEGGCKKCAQERAVEKSKENMQALSLKFCKERTEKAAGLLEPKGYRVLPVEEQMRLNTPLPANKNKVWFECDEHGVQGKLMYHLLQGSTCPECATAGVHSMTMPGSLYVLKAKVAGMDIYKVGITRQTVRRFQKLKWSTPFDFEVGAVLDFPEIHKAYEIEQATHSVYNLVDFPVNFDGCKEWVRAQNLELLLQGINMIKEGTNFKETYETVQVPMEALNQTAYGMPEWIPRVKKEPEPPKVRIITDDMLRHLQEHPEALERIHLDPTSPTGLRYREGILLGEHNALWHMSGKVAGSLSKGYIKVADRHVNIKYVQEYLEGVRQ